MRTAPLILLLVAGCGHPEPHAGLLTKENIDAIVPRGEVAGGRPGDFFLHNDLATFIIQRPGRELALGPYGGNLIDAALPGGGDNFGELIPVLALGRTFAFDSMRVVSDGSDHGPAVIEGTGVDVTNVYYNIEGISPALISYEPNGAGILGHDPDESMGLAVRVIYSLAPDEARLSIRYEIENIGGGDRLRVPLGLLLDTRGNIETFMTGNGYFSPLSRSLDESAIAQLLGYDTQAEQMVFVADDWALGVIPTRLGDAAPPRAIGATIPALGGAYLLESRSVLAAAKEPSFTIDVGESIDVELEVVLGATAHEALEQGWEILGRELEPVGGCVTLTTGEPATGVRVGMTDAGGRTLGTFDTGPDGCFTGRLPPGDYTAIAGATYRPPSAEVDFGVPGTVDLELEALGTIELDVGVYDTLDAIEPGRHPCRLTLVGERPFVEHPAIGEAPIDDPGGVVHRRVALRNCAGRVDVPAGRYLAIVTRGPELDRLERVVEVAGGEVTRVSGAIRRVVDSRGYAASDFHVHAIYSPDSKVPAIDRVLSIGVEGLDFWASTEHDVIADFSAAIRELGLEDELITMPGSEVTTFDTGHFGAYPLPVDPDRANGGSPDWAPRDNGRRPPMSELFEIIHGLGGLVQVNHPRSGPPALGAYFSRAGLTYDPVTKMPYADPARQELDNSHLRFPPGLSYFSTDFDIIEILNGASTYVRDGMVYERGAERAGHDWMNMLSYGMRIVAVGNSDTHSLGSPPGNPRTMVGGHDQGLVGLLDALQRGDVLITTGPMVRATLKDGSGRSAGLGDILSPATTGVTLQVEVETADWYAVDRLEVIANVFFPDTTSGGEAPAVTPRLMLTPEPVVRGNGGTAYVATAEVPLDLAAPPFSGRDSWIVVRVGGTSASVYPVMQSGGGTVNLSADTPGTFLSSRTGILPWAMTNPIFVDVDGDRRWAP